MSLAIPSAATHDFAPPSIPLLRFTVSQYHEMITAGILVDSDPVELLEGLLVKKMNKNPPHRIARGKARRAFEQTIPAGWYVDTQEPITTGESEPEPDVAIIRGRTEDYVDRHPGPADVALLVEVAEESLPRDRTDKKRIYAKARIPVYGIVNLVDRQVEVYTDPTGPADVPDYQKLRVHGENEAVPLIVEGKEISRLAVIDLLP